MSNRRALACTAGGGAAGHRRGAQSLGILAEPGAVSPGRVQSVRGIISDRRWDRTVLPTHVFFVNPAPGVEELVVVELVLGTSRSRGSRLFRLGPGEGAGGIRCWKSATSVCAVAPSVTALASGPNRSSPGVCDICGTIVSPGTHEGSGQRNKGTRGRAFSTRRRSTAAPAACPTETRCKGTATSRPVVFVCRHSAPTVSPLQQFLQRQQQHLQQQVSGLQVGEDAGLSSDSCSLRGPFHRLEGHRQSGTPGIGWLRSTSPT